MQNSIQNKLTVLGLSLLFLNLANQSIAQVTDFKMGDYKYRTKGMKAIGLNVGTNSTIANKSLAFGLAPATAYTKQYSLDNKQLEFWNWSSLSVSKTPVKDQPLAWMVSTRVSWTERMYKGNNFLQFGSNSFIGANNSPAPIIPNPFDSSDKEDNPKFYNVGLNPHVGVGQGRLEYISNAQMALFILEDLKEAGKIKGSVSKELTYKFTELVTQLYNTRVFDFRVRRNYEVAKIDSFLRQNKIISSTDVKTYNIIADNWNYAIQPSAIESSYFYSGTLQVPNGTMVSDRINANGQFGQSQRYAGTRTSIILDIPSSVSNAPMPIGNPYGGSFYGGLIGGNEFGEGDTLIDHTLYTTKGLNLNAMWENHKALSLHLQQVITFWAKGGSTSNNIKTVFTNNNPDSTSTTKATVMGLGASFGYSLFPNSRTVISTFSSLSFNRSISQIDKATKATLNAVTLHSGVNASYFINFRSRISGNVNLDYNTQPVAPTGVTNIGLAKGLNFNFFLTYVNYIF